MKTSSTSCDEFEDLVIGNEIFEAAHPGDRHHPGRRSARRTACRGRTLAGVGRRLGPPPRQARPYLAYAELDWKVWTHPDGDSFARYWVRLQETRESARMVVQSSTGSRRARSWRRCRRIIKVPEGEAWVDTENPLGEMGYYVVSKGATGPVPGEDPLRVVQQRLDRALVAARRLRARRHHHPGAASTSSSVTSTDDRRSDLWRSASAGAPPSPSSWSSARRLSRSARCILGYVFLFKMMSHMQSRLGPDGPGRLPRLVPARRRRR